MGYSQCKHVQYGPAFMQVSPHLLKRIVGTERDLPLIHWPCAGCFQAKLPFNHVAQVLQFGSSFDTLLARVKSNVEIVRWEVFADVMISFDCVYCCMVLWHETHRGHSKLCRKSAVICFAVVDYSILCLMYPCILLRSCMRQPWHACASAVPASQHAMCQSRLHPHPVQHHNLQCISCS